MTTFCSYNIHGLNKKVAPIKEFTLNNKLSLIGLLETRVQENVAKITSHELSPHFKWLYNYDHHLGGRIWIGWSPDFWSVDVLSSSTQHITCVVMLILDNVNFFVSFVYGLNTVLERRKLWEELSSLAT